MASADIIARMSAAASGNRSGPPGAEGTPAARAAVRAADEHRAEPGVQAAADRLSNRDHSLDRILRNLGATVLDVLAGDPLTVPDVENVVIFDPVECDPIPDRSLVLGVGLRTPDALSSVLADLAGRHAAGLVVRTPFAVDDGLRAKVADSGVTLLGLAPGATWHQLTTLLAHCLRDSRHRAISPATLGGMPTGDLFGLANAICALIDAPVTIEDRNNSVLAFSDRQDEADYVRIECILGRRTLEPWAQEDENRGAMSAIRRSPGPVYLAPIELEDERPTMPRVAVAIRAGDEMLGVIWAVVREPLRPDVSQLLLDASRLVALHMLELRAAGDAAQQLTSELAATVLDGGADAHQALTQLGLDNTTTIVLAMRPHDEQPAELLDSRALAVRTRERERAASALSVHLRALRPGTVVAAFTNSVYAIVPVRRVDDAEEALAATCRSFLQRLSVPRPMAIGVGRVADGLADLVQSRADADRAVRVLQANAAAGDGTDVAVASTIDAAALMLELRELADRSGRGPSGAFAKLLDYDRLRNASMVATLRAWLDAHGDIVLAAALCQVHQNTFRYRLRRISEIGQFDLDDAAARFAIELQVRLFGDAADAAADEQS